MEKKEFKETVTRVLNDYGFITKGKCLYLDLKDVVLVATIYPRYECNTLSYNFSLKAIHPEDDRKTGDPFEGYDSLLIDTASLDGVKFFELEKLNHDGLVADVSERVHRYFDPFRQDPMNHIIRVATDPNKAQKGNDIIPLKEIRKYLNLNY